MGLEVHKNIKYNNTSEFQKQIYEEQLVENGTDMNEDIIKYLVENGANLNKKNKENNSALHFACKIENENIVKYLIEQGVDVDIKNNNGDTPLTIACEKDNLNIVEFLIKNRANLNNVNKEGNTPLIVACINNKDAIIKYLIKQDVKLDEQNEKGDTALIIACRNENTDIVKYMIDYGADRMKINKNNETLFSIACENNQEAIIKYIYDNCFFGNKDVIKKLLLCYKNQIPLSQKELNDESEIIDNEFKYYNTPLIIAVNNQNEKIIDYLIKMGADVNQENSKGELPLTTAIKKGNLKIVKLLVKKGANINKENKYGSTPFTTSCRYNNEEIVKHLIKKGADINKGGGSNGDTPLINACEKEYENIVKILISYKADVNKANYKGITPLIKICNNDFINEEILKLLIENKADVNKRHYRLGSPLNILFNKNELNEKFIKYLIEKGADVNSENEKGDTPLIIACRNNNENLIKCLIDHGADVNKESGENRDTPLIICCDKEGIDNKRIIQYLIEHGADVNKENEKGDTPLIRAFHKRNDNIIPYLIDMGADVDKENKLEYSPLKIVFETEYENALDYLKKADVNKIKRNGNTYLIDACISGNIKFINYLIEKGADVNKKSEINGNTPLIVVCNKDIENINLFNELIENEADINLKNKNGDTALSLSCYKGNDTLVKFLIDKGSDVNHENEKGDTPLIMACKSKNMNKNENIVNIVKYLIEHGAHINEENKNGDTPLIAACDKYKYYANQRLIKYLIEHGAHINEENKNGDTPLIVSCKFSNEDYVKYLIEYGANINKNNNNGDTPLIIAKKGNNEKIIEYLHKKIKVDQMLFRNKIKSMIKNDIPYEIHNESFHEWKIYDWNQLEASLTRSPHFACSSNFKIGDSIWRIELRLEKKSSNGDETYSVYLKNMDSSKYVYLNFVFYILNYEDYNFYEAKESEEIKFYNENSNIFGIDSFISKSKLSNEKKPLVIDGEKVVLGIYVRIYKKIENGFLTHLSPEQQYKNMIKLKYNKDNGYEIQKEDFYEWKINLNACNNSTIYSSNFKIGNYMWRIELNNFKDNKKFIKVFLRNLDRHEYIYVKFVSSLYNKIDHASNIENTKNITKESTDLMRYTRNNDIYGVNLYVNEDELKEKLSINDNDSITIVVFLRIYKKIKNLCI